MTTPATMTDDERTTLCRFWQGTSYMQDQHLRRIRKRVQAITTIRKAMRKAVVA